MSQQLDRRPDHRRGSASERGGIMITETHLCIKRGLAAFQVEQVEAATHDLRNAPATWWPPVLQVRRHAGDFLRYLQVPQDCCVVEVERAAALMYEAHLLADQAFERGLLRVADPAGWPPCAICLWLKVGQFCVVVPTKIHLQICAALPVTIPGWHVTGPDGGRALCGEQGEYGTGYVCLTCKRSEADRPCAHVLAVGPFVAHNAR